MPVVLTKRTRWLAIFGSISSARTDLRRWRVLSSLAPRIAGDIGCQDRRQPTLSAVRAPVFIGVIHESKLTLAPSASISGADRRGSNLG
jgi:hypothetical protein